VVLAEDRVGTDEYDPEVKFLSNQGPMVLFLIVLAEQLGLPLPAVPVLLAMGAMVGTGRFSFAAVMAIAVGACLVADFAWYRLGRWRGARVLNWLCRISLEPDSCVRTAQDRLAFGGARALLVAKFFPGFSTAAPPVAGLIGMRVSRFLLWDAMGAVLWSATYLGLGWLFSDQLERVMRAVTDVGGRAFFLAAAALAAYLAGKAIQRKRFLRQIALDRITPEELNARLAAGEDIVVVDLRHSAEFEADHSSLPRALRIAPDAIDTHFSSIPAGREVVLFCT
jgi:membrane protein DedA with SNARE-associated domain